MPMSDGLRTLKKIEFLVGERSFKFAINPENMTYTRPHRTTALKTKSRIVIEDFQSDIPTVTISGTTGFNPTGRAQDRGIIKIKEMKSYLEAYAEMGGNGNTSAEEFYFYDYTNDESYVVHLSPEGVKYTQDVNEPLLHRYEIKFIILRKASEPSDGDVIDPEIGNSTPSITNGLPNYLAPNTAIPMPNPNVSNTAVPMPTPIIPYPGLNMPSYVPPGGNTSGGHSFYNEGTGGMYTPNNNNAPINPQAPSTGAVDLGSSALGFQIGYYLGRSFTV